MPQDLDPLTSSFLDNREALKAYLAALLCKYEWESDGENEPKRVYNFTLEPESMPICLKTI